MSVVLTSDAVQRFVSLLVSYQDNFWGMLTDNRIVPAGLPEPDWITDSGGTTEQIEMFRQWLRESRKSWPGFAARWKYHFFPIDQRANMREDWLPPITWTAASVKSFALPQFPQQRVRIPDPTDSLNHKRSIRVHYAENNQR